MTNRPSRPPEPVPMPDPPSTAELREGYMMATMDRATLISLGHTVLTRPYAFEDPPSRIFKAIAAELTERGELEPPRS